MELSDPLQITGKSPLNNLAGCANVVDFAFAIKVKSVIHKLGRVSSLARAMVSGGRVELPEWYSTARLLRLSVLRGLRFRIVLVPIPAKKDGIHGFIFLCYFLIITDGFLL